MLDSHRFVSEHNNSVFCFFIHTMLTARSTLCTKTVTKETTHFISLIFHSFPYILLKIKYTTSDERMMRIVYEFGGCEKKAPDMVNDWPGKQPSLSLEINVCTT